MLGVTETSSKHAAHLHGQMQTFQTHTKYELLPSEDLPGAQETVVCFGPRIGVANKLSLEPVSPGSADCCGCHFTHLHQRRGKDGTQQSG